MISRVDVAELYQAALQVSSEMNSISADKA